MGSYSCLPRFLKPNRSIIRDILCRRSTEIREVMPVGVHPRPRRIRVPMITPSMPLGQTPTYHQWLMQYKHWQQSEPRIIQLLLVDSRTWDPNTRKIRGCSGLRCLTCSSPSSPRYPCTKTWRDGCVIPLSIL